MFNLRKMNAKQVEQDTKIIRISTLSLLVPIQNVSGPPYPDAIIGTGSTGRYTAVH